jgi:hypothetical protein
MFPKRGAPMETDAHYQSPIPIAVLHSSFTDPGVRAPFQVSQRGIRALCKMYRLPLYDFQIIVNYVDHKGHVLSHGTMMQSVNLSLMFFLSHGLQLLKCMK